MDLTGTEEWRLIQNSQEQLLRARRWWEGRAQRGEEMCRSSRRGPRPTLLVAGTREREERRGWSNRSVAVLLAYPIAGTRAEGGGEREATVSSWWWPGWGCVGAGKKGIKQGYSRPKSAEPANMHYNLEYSEKIYAHYNLE